MLLGFDGNEANEVRPDIGAPAGVNVYAFELLKAIYKLQDEWSSRHKVVVYLKHAPSENLPKPNQYFYYKVISGKGFWVLTRLTPHLFKTKPGVDRPDVIFSPSHYAPPYTPMPKACSIMDLGYLRYTGHLKKKDYWQLVLWTARSIKSSKLIFAISESTKADIVRHYPDTSDKIVVTHLGYNQEIYKSNLKTAKKKEIGRMLRRYSIGQEYVLFLSVIKPSKNVNGLISAWAKLVDEFPKITLVIGGKKGWHYQEIETEVKKLNLADKIVFTNYVSEEDKPLLIAGAKVFILPSYWEGFGHDVVHALALGVPVAVSKVGSLPEVAGKGGVYFNPDDTDDIANKIRHVLTLREKEYNELVKAGLSQVKKFSWEDTARITLNSLEKIK